MIDDFIKNGLARQFAARNQSRVTVMTAEDDNNIIGYYAINAHSVEREELPPEFFAVKPETKIRTSSELGAIFLSRFGVSRQWQGRGLGVELLVHALQRSFLISRQLGVFCITLDALNERAARFYEERQFKKWATELRPSRYYLSTATLSSFAKRWEAQDEAMLPNQPAQKP